MKILMGQIFWDDLKRNSVIWYQFLVANLLVNYNLLHFLTIFFINLLFFCLLIKGKLTGVPNRDCGEIVIVTEEVQSCKQIAHIQFRAENLKKFSWLCGNDPFLVISRSNEDGSHSVVVKTEVAKSTQNPVWAPIHIRATTLCNGDFDRNIKIDCYDRRSNGSHKLIGTCYTSLRILTSMSDNQPKMNLTSQNDTNGVLKVEKINLVEDISFLDYIRNGTQLHFAVAIDFTASNGMKIA